MNKAAVINSRGLGTTILALFLVLCLAECATGSCLSYGHSCWGAHGKRSSRPPIAAPDWYLTRMLRRMGANADVNRVRQFPARENEINTIYQMEIPEAPAAEKLTSEDQDSPGEAVPRAMEAKPMLDDDLLSEMKLYQFMKQASQEK